MKTKISAGSKSIRILFIGAILVIVILVSIIIPSEEEQRLIAIFLIGIISLILFSPFIFDSDLVKTDTELIVQSLFKSNRYNHDEIIYLSEIKYMGPMMNLFKVRVRDKSFFIRYYYSELLDNHKLKKSRREFIALNKTSLVIEELANKHQLNMTKT